MKNIVILGVARAGKTTLAKLIANKYKKYQIINGDCIRNSFQNIFPQIEINKFGGEGMKEKFSLFCSELLEQEIIQNKDYFNYIFESCDVTPENARKHFSLNNTIVVFLGYPKLSVEQIIYNYKNYAEENDYMLKKTDGEIMNRAILWLQKSKEYQEQCKLYNIKYIDVSYNRNNIFDEFIKDL